MTTTFEWVREQLIGAGHSGVSPSDLFKGLRESEVKRGGGTYQSFLNYFWTLVRLGWVEPSGVTAPADQVGIKTERVLSDRVFYTLTHMGASVSADLWHDPLRVLYPQLTYKATGKPRGRPRKFFFT